MHGGQRRPAAERGDAKQTRPCRAGVLHRATHTVRKGKWKTWNAVGPAAPSGLPSLPCRGHIGISSSFFYFSQFQFCFGSSFVLRLLPPPLSLCSEKLFFRTHVKLSTYHPSFPVLSLFSCSISCRLSSLSPPLAVSLLLHHRRNSNTPAIGLFLIKITNFVLCFAADPSLLSAERRSMRGAAARGRRRPPPPPLPPAPVRFRAPPTLYAV
jgi:hypothetical protein